MKNIKGLSDGTSSVPRPHHSSAVAGGPLVANPTLFRALEKRFGTVRISDKGDGTENYSVNCPFCGDQRGRLSIHSSFGTREPGERWARLGMVNCFNEGCLESFERRKELFDYVYTSTGTLPLQFPGSRPDKVVTRVARKLSELPRGRYFPVHRLQRHDEARRYLEDRGFDVAQLWEERRVLYCQVSPESRPRIDDRIVVPYFDLPIDWDAKADPSLLQLVGYIARNPGDAEYEGLSGAASTKYLLPSGFAKSDYLYGLEHAANGSGLGVVCEGVTDVWRLRGNAVALTGKTVSATQEELLARQFEGRPLVVLLDADARGEAEDIARRLRKRRGFLKDEAPVYSLAPPKGHKDIGECNFDEAWDAIAECTGNSADELKAAARRAVQEWNYPAPIECWNQ